jgi:hypothetical protein
VVDFAGVGFVFFMMLELSTVCRVNGTNQASIRRGLIAARLGFCTVDLACNAHGVGVPAERVHFARCGSADIAFGHACYACGIL